MNPRDIITYLIIFLPVLIPFAIWDFQATILSVLCTGVVVGWIALVSTYMDRSNL